MRYEHSPHLKFCSLSSEIAEEHFFSHKFDYSIDSIILFKNGTYYSKSDAVLELIPFLKPSFMVLKLGWIVPRVVRDAVYDLIAKHRHKIIKQNDTCHIPTIDISKRFLT